MKDTIADMIIQLKNAGSARKESVVLPYSKIKYEIADVLQKSGFIKSVSKKGKKVIKYIDLGILYHSDGMPKIRGAQRISKTSKRVYIKSKDIHPVRSGFGIMIISTPKGIMNDEMARKEKVGGELLFKLW